MTDPSTTPTQHFASAVDSTQYEPFVVGDGTIGEVHWLRTEGSDGSALAAGLWKSDARTFDYPFTADETIHILSGAVAIAIRGGEDVRLVSGDIASFAKGTESVWTVTDKFKKFFVVSG